MSDLVISGVIDGPLAGGLPKAIELTVLADIADLSVYGLGSANNGGGTDGQEFTFPAVSAAAGDVIYLASEAEGFSAYFGFAPDYTGAAASINGDDAIELFENGTLVDLFGAQDVDGSGTPWEYTDGWAYREADSGPSAVFDPAQWVFSGPDALDGASSNATAAAPFPAGRYAGADPVPGEDDGQGDDGETGGDTGGEAPIAAAIYEIQGAGHVSPFVLDDGQDAASFLENAPDLASVSGAVVVTSGVVSAVAGNGFYLQDPTGDGDAATSDAIFVFTGAAPSVSAGAAVEVQGQVSEFFPGGAGSGNLPTTQISGASVTTTGTGTLEPVVIGADGRQPPTMNIDDDSFASFDPESDGADFFESLEGMLVTASDAVAVSGTNQFGEIFAAVDQGADATGLSQRGTLNIAPDDFQPEKVQIDTDGTVSGFEAPLVDVGARLGDVTGVVSYGFGNYELVPTEDFRDQVVPSDLAPQTGGIEGGAGRLSVASYNVLNLDPNDDDNLDGTPGTGNDDLDVAEGRFALIARQIAENLNAPDVIGLQEIQDNNGTVGQTGSGVVAADETLQLLVDEIEAAGGPSYAYIDNTFIREDASGGYPGGNIRVAYLYNPERAELVEGSVRPIGSQDPGATFDGERLPLAADFTVDGETVTVINLHMSSKGGSAPVFGTSQPFSELQEDPEVNGSLNERRAQAQEVNDFIDALMADTPDAKVVVTGDMNEFEFVSPLEILAGSKTWTGTEVIDTPDEAVLANLTNTLQPDERYSYNFQGNSQSLDHILVSRNLAQGAEFEAVHVNSEFAVTDATASDHDPLLAGIDLTGEEAEEDDTPFQLDVTRVARSDAGAFDEGAAEIVAHEDGRFYVTNADAGTVDMFERQDGALVRVGQVAVGQGGPNSVAVNGGLVAVAVAAETVTDNGSIALYDAGTLAPVATLDAGGALPDMVTFSKDGTQLFVAIEGEPNDDYTVDPVGGVSIVDLDRADPAASTVTFAGFEAFDDRLDELREAGVRVFGPGASVSQDLEPEYIAEGDGQLVVTLQEANAFGILDLETRSFTDVVPLGYKDHSIPGNGLDGSNEDGGVNIAEYPIFGMYQPDTIAAFETGGRTWYATANEGDSRDYDGYSEEAEVQDVTLDPEAFPDAGALQAPEAIGELGITTSRGDTDGDGDFDELYVYGARSFAIWDDAGQLVWDSGDMFERIIAEELPADLFNVTNDAPFDTEDRSDDKGPEPEAIAIADVGGRPIAVVGMERQNGLMFFDVSDPEAPEYLKYVSTIDLADRGTGDAAIPYPNSDLGPEGIAVIDAAESESGLTEIAVSNEISGTVSVYTLEDLMEDDSPETPAPAPAPFTLELLHVADQEAATGAIVDAPNLSAVMNALEAQDLGDDGVADNTIRLSSGDAFIPGVFFQASEAVFGAAGIADIQIQNELGLQAVSLGNHEFDLGSDFLAGLISGEAEGDFSALEASGLAGRDFAGTAFPYLSSNLDFSTSPELSPLAVEAGGAPLAGTVTSSVVIEENGELIGVVGATTPALPTIASPGALEVSPDWETTTPTEAELDALAAIVQSDVDALLSDNPSLNKIVLLSHMQQLDIELQLAERLEGVDIIVAGGSNTRLFDDTDRARAGDSDQGQYPQFVENADGGTTAVVNTDGSYKYVGRLVVDFDEEGRIIPESYDANVSGAYATDAQGVADLGAEDMVDPEIQAIADAIEDRIVATESNVFGVSDVFLNGFRSGSFDPEDPDGVRTQETNLGNLTADANLAAAQAYDETVMVSIKNGGGIRASIGEVTVPPGGSEAVRSPTEEIVGSDGEIIKPEGGISQNDIATALAFNNGLSLLTLTRAELVEVLEYGVSALDTGDEGGVAGQFPQVSGVQFSFDDTEPSGARIQSAAITDGAGNDMDVLVEGGEIVGDASQEVRIVTLNFLASGGDGYPFPQEGTDRVDLFDLDGDGEIDGTLDGAATFAAAGTEQDALAEYLASDFATAETAFSGVDTGPVEDTRIQNLFYREDTVIDAAPAANVIAGTDGVDRLVGTDGDDVIATGAGAYDFATGGAGADTFVFGDEALNGVRERDVILDFEAGVDRIALAPGVEVSQIREAGPQVVVYLDDPEGRDDAIFVRGDGLTAENIDIVNDYMMLA